ncbi:MAG: hypothetical protein JF886_13545 [Candidatus Dormibacteraeota bacterium]|uniref:Uncharacterized protein n=1 Tax=Candidatus Aeolococcus gillhamiae TaxID=3127015 RepID=A0A934K5D1_9BACT|nr:hypothetical protein [Candidatus Dormibacteraeota bacterium]
MDQSTTAQASSSTIVLLWADTFATSLTKPGAKGIKSPSTGAIVDTKALAQMMIAVPLAALHTSGAIRLEQFSKKSFGFLASNGVNVVVVGEVPPGGRVEERIAKSKKAREKGESVADLVMAALSRKPNPDGEVVQWGVDEAVKLGYMQREGAGGLRGMTGATTVTPNAERIEETRARAAGLADSWLTFRDGNPELATALRMAIGSGIDARRSKSDLDERDVEG